MASEGVTNDSRITQLPAPHVKATPPSSTNTVVGPSDPTSADRSASQARMEASGTPARNWVNLAASAMDATDQAAFSDESAGHSTPLASERLIDDGKTLAILPASGLSIRASAGGSRLSIASTGTFVRDTGERDKDSLGRVWMKITTTDVQDRRVEGWVLPEKLLQFDSRLGAMDETGRINPTAERNRMDEVTVRRYDSLWNIAKSHGWDFRETIDANSHLINRSRIFPGDTVYVPGSEKGPIQMDSDPESANSVAEVGNNATGGQTTEQTNLLEVAQTDQDNAEITANEATAPNPLGLSEETDLLTYGSKRDGRVDAYRHILWNARLTMLFGIDWSRYYSKPNHEP